MSRIPFAVLACSASLWGGLALTASPLQGSEDDARPDPRQLELEAPDGSLRKIRAGEPVLTDPRLEQAWIVRVLGGRPEASADAEDSDLLQTEVTLVGGDRLRGALHSGEGESLTLRIAGGALLPLSIDVLASVVVPANLPAALAAPLEAPSEGDRIYRRTGATLDRDDGAVIGFEEEGVLFESAVLGERSVPWSELAALFVETFEEEADEAQIEGVSVSVDLTDGGRLRGRCERLDAENLTLLVGGQTTLALPLGRVATLTVEDGRLTYLSELKPTEEIGRGAPFGDELGLVLGHEMDRAVMGKELVVAGRRHARGIGMHAPARLRFDLPPEWRQLRGKVGIDDSSARLPEEARGSVVFRVRLNDALLWESSVVRGGESALALPALTLPASDSPRRLELEVDPVEDFRGDRANWLDLLLIR